MSTTGFAKTIKNDNRCACLSGLIRAACTVFSQINNVTAMNQCFRTDRSGQTVQTQIRLLLEEQSDQGLHCLLFHLHFFEEIPRVLEF